jgi:hypothetical protein
MQRVFDRLTMGCFVAFALGAPLGFPGCPISGRLIQHELNPAE